MLAYAYAYEAQEFDDPDPKWLGCRGHDTRHRIKREIMPDVEPEEWTPAIRAAVSRALSRLEARGMITRIGLHRRCGDETLRTREISLTEYGAAVHRSVVATAAGSP